MNWYLLDTFGAIAETFIVPSFAISELILTNIPKALETLSSKLIFPLFIDLPLVRVTFVVTELSLIKAIAAALSALSFPLGFFLKVIVPVVSFTKVTVPADSVAAYFIP